MLELIKVIFAVVLESGSEVELALGDPDVVVLNKRVESGNPLEPDEFRLDMLVDNVVKLDKVPAVVALIPVDDGMEVVPDVLKLKPVVDIGVIAVPDPDEVILEMLVGSPDMDEALTVVAVLILGIIVTVLFI